jgi:hypothetical protein
MPFMPLTLPVTPARINFNVRNTKYPDATAAAIGKPTSATSLKNSPICTSFYNYYWNSVDLTLRSSIIFSVFGKN